MKAADSAMAETYNAHPNKVYMVLDLITLVRPAGKSTNDSKNYSKRLLQFMATVEWKWFEEEGGLPHQNKMYGFNDPDGAKKLLCPIQ